MFRKIAAAAAIIALVVISFLVFTEQSASATAQVGTSAGQLQLQCKELARDVAVATLANAVKEGKYHDGLGSAPDHISPQAMPNLVSLLVTSFGC